MKVYVAARFNEKDEVRRIYTLLKEKGHEITADWTQHRLIKPYDQHPETAKEYAIEDMNGVLDCDVFILLTSENTGSGSSAELGAAIALQGKFGKPKIYVVGEYMGNNCFYYHPGIRRVRTIDEALQKLP